MSPANLDARQSRDGRRSYPRDEMLRIARAPALWGAQDEYPSSPWDRFLSRHPRLDRFLSFLIWGAWVALWSLGLFLYLT